MAHIEDRWHRAVKGADGRPSKERTARYGNGLRWRARYLDPDGKERNRSFATKVMAERFLTEVEHSKIAGSYRDPDAGQVTLRKYAAGWVQAYPADSTRGEQIRRQMENHILPKLGAKTLGELERRPSLVQQFMSGLPMGPGGASQIGITLTSILAAAVDDQLINRNPCKAQSVKMPRQPKSKITPWTMGQAEEIRAGLPGRWQAVVDCGTGLGMRQGEIFAFGPDEIDFLHQAVYVRRQVKRVNGRLWFALPKGGKEREVPLEEDVSLRLAAHIETYAVVEVTLPWNEPENPKRHGKPVTAPLLFTRDSGPLNHSTFYTGAWRPARNAAGITEGSLHQLRHLFASVLLAGGVDIKALSEYLGHHDPTVTLRIYAHLMPSAKGRALKAIKAAFAEARGPMTAQERKSAR
jgi:integrase